MKKTLSTLAFATIAGAFGMILMTLILPDLCADACSVIGIFIYDVVQLALASGLAAVVMLHQKSARPFATAGFALVELIVWKPLFYLPIHAIYRAAILLILFAAALGVAYGVINARRVRTLYRVTFGTGILIFSGFAIYYWGVNLFVMLAR